MTDWRSKNVCPGCGGEPEPGFIEQPNNGPIVACPYCNADWDSDSARRQREYDAAEEQRARGTAPPQDSGNPDDGRPRRSGSSAAGD